MNALNHKWICLAIVLLVTALVIAGCQPASQEQPAATQPPTAIPQPTATTRPTDTPQPTATTAPTATPTVVPNEIVLAEGEADCPLMDFEEEPGSGKISDPELGDTYRAVLQKSRYSCAEPYFNVKCVFIVDILPGWSGFGECVTDEGGVWKGTGKWVLKPQYLSSATHELLKHFIAVGSFKGEGLFKGLQFYFESDQGSTNAKYRVTKSVLKVLPTATPTAAPTEMVLTEGEANCPLVDFEEEPGPKLKDPDLGDVYRAFVQKFNFTCPEPYLKGKCVEIQDFSSLEDYTYPPYGLIECVTDEGGVWKGTYEWALKPQFVQNKPHEVNHFTSLGIFKGEAQYKGLQMSTEYDLETSNMKFRVTRLVEEPVLISSAEMLFVHWQPLSKSPDAMFLQFNLDGTCRQSSTLEGLANVPEVECTYAFEGTNLVMTEVKVHGVPPCPSPIGKYEVWQTADDQIRLDAVEDTCAPRRSSTIGVYQRLP